MKLDHGGEPDTKQLSSTLPNSTKAFFKAPVTKRQIKFRSVANASFSSFHASETNALYYFCPTLKSSDSFSERESIKRDKLHTSQNYALGVRGAFVSSVDISPFHQIDSAQFSEGDRLLRPVISSISQAALND